MEIQEIHLKNFGKFTDERIQFHSGINVISGENEAGKSTICSFIRGMLFGIDRARGRAARNDEYTIRQPWENPAFFSGDMRFVSGGKTFYLERVFSSADRQVRLICEDDGEELDVQAGDLEVLLDDITLPTYNNTFYLGNRTGVPDEVLAEEIHNYMVNISTGNDASINVIQACEKLKKQRKELEQRKKRLVEETSIAAREVQMKIEYEHQELESLQEEEEELQGEWKRIYLEEQGEAEDEDRTEEYQNRKNWIVGKIAMVFLALAGLGTALFFEMTAMKIVAVGLIFLACIGVRYFSVEDQKLREDWMQRRWQKKDTMPKKKQLEMNMEWVHNTREERILSIQNLEEEQEELQKKSEAMEELEIEIAALLLAEKTIEEVTAEIYQEYEDRINERVSEILSFITNGRYDRILVDKDLKVKIFSNQRILTLDQVSRGTMEQICFALRMAAGEILNQGEPLPVILDDAFLTYDDERLKNTLKWMENCGRQVLLFTCQKREKELLQ